MKKKLLLLSFVCITFLVHAQQTTIWSENFDTENLSDWTLIDADGDGFNWQTIQMLGPNWQPIGTPFLSSNSYTQYNGIGNMFPDNWAITPAIDLSSVTPGETVKLNWAIVDSAYSWNPSPNNENYAVYIAETKDTVAFIGGGIKYTEHNTPIVYTVRTLDISEYVGKTIYIAFRHYNVSDSIQVPFSSSVEFDDMSVIAGTIASIPKYMSNQELSVYPNPVNESFELKLSDKFNILKSKVEIMELTGNVVTNYNEYRNKIFVKNLPSGVYIVRVNDGEHYAIRKLIKK